MFEQLRTTIIEWNQRTTDRQKLQHSYVALLMLTVLIAGLVSLVSAERSRQLMYVSIALITTLVVNFVVWGLLKSTLLDKLPRTSTRVARTNQSTSRQSRR